MLYLTDLTPNTGLEKERKPRAEKQPKPDHKGFLFYYPISKERYTIAGIVSEDGTKVSIGVVACSKQDQFVKAIGRTLALEKARTNPDAVFPVKNKKPRKSFVEMVRFMFPDKYNIVVIYSGPVKRYSNGETPQIVASFRELL